MGRALAQAEPAASQTFRDADRILAIPLSQVCFEGPASGLDQTEFTQPALLTHSVAVLRVLREKFPDLEALAAAGHSLGEFSALVAAEALTFEDALRLVRARGLAMKHAGEIRPGGMAAVLGLDVAQVDSACQEAARRSGSVVQVANDNCLGQVVISGAEAGLAAAGEILQAHGARKVVRLAVSIAAHSALMVPAQEQFQQALAGAQIADPILPVVGNVHASPLRTAADVRADLSAQLTSRVRWTESVQAMAADGIQRFVELGTGSVLSGLLRRIDRQATGLSVGEPQDLVRLAL
jgi:[acyl-carrier-protein] S-malonyltransferase